MFSLNNSFCFHTFSAIITGWLQTLPHVSYLVCDNNVGDFKPLLQKYAYIRYGTAPLVCFFLSTRVCCFVSIIWKRGGHNHICKSNVAFMFVKGGYGAGAQSAAWRRPGDRAANLQNLPIPANLGKHGSVTVRISLNIFKR